jgi:hypothetical protein
MFICRLRDNRHWETGKKYLDLVLVEGVSLPRFAFPEGRVDYD